MAHKTDADELAHACQLLSDAGVCDIDVIDNSPDDRLRNVCEQNRANYIFNSGKNLGYGTAHNLSLRRSIEDPETEYHLVINSDVDFKPEIISQIINKMDSDKSIGQLGPRVVYPDGRLQPTVRLLPTPTDLIFRRFLPSRLNKKRNNRFTLADWDHSQQADIPYHQGSFMFLRTSALKDVGLFDERFFMYPEDIDLTRRIHSRYKTLYWPEVTISHCHRAGSYHSKKLLAIHLVNMVRYFNKWGWIFDKERRAVNKNVLENLGLK